MRILLALILLAGCTSQPEVPSFKINTLCNFEGVLRCDVNDGECWCVPFEEEKTWYAMLIGN